MHSNALIQFALFLCASCNQPINFPEVQNIHRLMLIKPALMDMNPFKTIAEIPLPDGFIRLTLRNDSFGKWLLTVKLKKDKKVYLFDGKEKPNQTAQFAVIDISAGKNNLQQCADAVMRLRAEYLFANQKYTDIIFKDNNGKAFPFGEPYNVYNLRLYLDRVFASCGTASLSKQLHKKNMTTIQAGDVIIRGGFPGHAVIVMSVAENKEGKIIYLLAQSYMPAQDIHVLNNPINKSLSPWYQINDQALIKTPQYTFSKEELMGW